VDALPDPSRSVHERVKGPGIGLIVVGSLGVLLYALHFVEEALVAWVMRKFDVAEVDIARTVEHLHPLGLAFDYAQYLIGIAGSAFVLYGGTQMLALRHRTIVFSAAILVMIPCFTDLCCVIGIPVGILSIIALNRPDVRQAFTS
jgi:hypothetical protein